MLRENNERIAKIVLQCSAAVLYTAVYSGVQIFKRKCLFETICTKFPSFNIGTCILNRVNFIAYFMDEKCCQSCFKKRLKLPEEKEISLHGAAELAQDREKCSKLARAVEDHVRPIRLEKDATRSDKAQKNNKKI